MPFSQETANTNGGRRYVTTTNASNSNSQHVPNDLHHGAREGRKRSSRPPPRAFPRQTLVHWHEELVPLKGCDRDENNDETHYTTTTLTNNTPLSRRWRASHLSSCKERSLSVISITASLIALSLCAAWAVTSTLFGTNHRPYGGNAVENNGRPDNSPFQVGFDTTSTATFPSSDTDTAGVHQSRNRPLRHQHSSPALLHPPLYDELGRYVLSDYDAQPPSANFLPALAGCYGKPLYAFFVNRGQAIASFGFESKQYPILEFEAAHRAYQNTPLRGFRTFLQLSRPTAVLPGSQDETVFIVEPFSPLQTRRVSSASSLLPRRTMYVGGNELQLQEIDTKHGIETNVTFFVLPEEDFGAFVKRTTITNLPTAGSTLRLSLLDGLARLEPAGGKLDHYLKTMGRTLEAWMGVYQPYDDTITMPFYRLSTEPTDSASVVVQRAGHWCLSFLETTTTSSRRHTHASETVDPTLLPIIYDPDKIFGSDTTLITPAQLFEKPIAQIIADPQYSFAKTPSAFAALEHYVLEPGESITISTFFGKANDIFEVPVISRRLLQPGLVQRKLARSREIIHQITGVVQTRTSHPLFDGHVQQMFLDNALQGGLPTIFGELDDDARLRSADEDGRLKVYHLFSRINGDLERDYNNFVIEPTFFSQGPGNFRNVIQNRRNDVQFNPRVGSFNIRTFLSFIQADGYEPLSIEAIVFTIDDIEVCKQIAARAVGEADGHRAQREALTGILNGGPFRPGQVFALLEEGHIELIISKQEFIDELAAASKTFPMAVYKSGYWADHFTYYLDLINSFLSIFPELEERVLFEQSLPYFFSPAFVKPRSQKYVLSTSFDGFGIHVRQLDATDDEDHEKKLYREQSIKDSTSWFDNALNWQHDSDGKIFASKPMEKLFLLATLKFATRDAFGMGIEYEGGRPGFNDANNGLVGMLGSGTPELFELCLLLRYIEKTVKKYNQYLRIPDELNELIMTMDDALDQLSDVVVTKLNATVPWQFFEYWNTVASARETYRSKTKITFSGKTTELNTDRVTSLITRWQEQIELGKDRALFFGSQEGTGTPYGITPTYFFYTITSWEKTGHFNKDGHSFAVPQELKVGVLPLFLEGPTRMMKNLNVKDAKKLYQKVRNSTLRDNKLGMYTISENLKGQSFDIGRETSFASGWLENQSVWLHISYKFYLELLRKGLYNEFYEEMTTGGMLPFMDPQVYGRSPMECSSFIASSAFDDPTIRGRGFLGRLSGTTAEFLSIWLLMMIGPQPFFVDSNTGSLRMQLVPALPRKLFYTDNDSIKSGMTLQSSIAASKINTSATPKLSFKLFGSIDVTYHHHRGDEDLFHVAPSRYVIVLRDGATIQVDGPIIQASLAEKIRRVILVESIDAYFEYTTSKTGEGS